jgi:small subunit ribosomal protein S20
LFDRRAHALPGPPPTLIKPRQLTSLGLLPQTPAPEKEQSVANTKSAEKAARQAEKHRSHNVTLRSRMRTAIRKVVDAVAKGDKNEAQSSYRAAVPVIDTLVNKRIIHRNQADRHKSRLAARVKALSTGSTGSAPR